MIKKIKRRYLVMPIPYAKGMKASIDGHAVKLKSKWYYDSYTC